MRDLEKLGRKAAEYLYSELRTAKIKSELDRKNGGLPYGIIGAWRFTREPTYWDAECTTGMGISLDRAIKFNGRRYVPETGEWSGHAIPPRRYGQVVRVGGMPDGASPKDFAFPDNDTLYKELSRLHDLGYEKDIGPAEILRLCESGDIKGERFVSYYQVDTQQGLNSFSKLIRL